MNSKPTSTSHLERQDYEDVIVTRVMERSHRNSRGGYFTFTKVSSNRGESFLMKMSDDLHERRIAVGDQIRINTSTHHVLKSSSSYECWDLQDKTIFVAFGRLFELSGIAASPNYILAETSACGKHVLINLYSSAKNGNPELLASIDKPSGARAMHLGRDAIRVANAHHKECFYTEVEVHESLAHQLSPDSGSPTPVIIRDPETNMYGITNREKLLFGETKSATFVKKTVLRKGFHDGIGLPAIHVTGFEIKQEKDEIVVFIKPHDVELLRVDVASTFPVHDVTIEKVKNGACFKASVNQHRAEKTTVHVRHFSTKSKAEKYKNLIAQFLELFEELLTTLFYTKCTIDVRCAAFYEMKRVSDGRLFAIDTSNVSASNQKGTYLVNNRLFNDSPKPSAEVQRKFFATKTFAHDGRLRLFLLNADIGLKRTETFFNGVPILVTNNAECVSNDAVVSRTGPNSEFTKVRFGNSEMTFSIVLFDKVESWLYEKLVELKKAVFGVFGASQRKPVGKSICHQNAGQIIGLDAKPRESNWRQAMSQVSFDPKAVSNETKPQEPSGKVQDAGELVSGKLPAAFPSSPEKIPRPQEHFETVKRSDYLYEDLPLIGNLFSLDECSAKSDSPYPMVCMRAGKSEENATIVEVNGWELHFSNREPYPQDHQTSVCHLISDNTYCVLVETQANGCKIVVAKYESLESAEIAATHIREQIRLVNRSRMERFYTECKIERVFKTVTILSTESSTIKFAVDVDIIPKHEQIIGRTVFLNTAFVREHQDWARTEFLNHALVQEHQGYADPLSTVIAPKTNEAPQVDSSAVASSSAASSLKLKFVMDDGLELEYFPATKIFFCAGISTKITPMNPNSPPTVCVGFCPTEKSVKITITFFGNSGTNDKRVSFFTDAKLALYEKQFVVQDIGRWLLELFMGNVFDTEELAKKK